MKRMIATLAISSLPIAALFLLTGASQSDETESPAQPSGISEANTEPPSSSSTGAPSTSSQSRDEILKSGTAVADVEAASMLGVVRPTTPQTADGAVSAATSYLGWFLAAPGARDEPKIALTMAAPNLPPTTAQSMLASLRLGEPSEVDTSRGAYRVLGWSGDQQRPDQVMVSLALPVTSNGELKWLGFSSILSWEKAGWQLANAQPEDLKENPTTTSAQGMPDDTVRQTLPGPGWQTFANGV